MAKAQKKVQEQEMGITEIVATDPTNDVYDGTEKSEIVREGPEVDASGRKKKVDLSMEQLEEKGLKNKSQVIRFLDSEGYSRSAIALFLNVRYQHVRNVLVTPLKKG